MTILELIQKAAGPADALHDFLTKAGQKYPDLQATALDLSAKLQAAVSTQNLVDLATALPKELGDIAQGKFDGRRHPSDIV